jgi:hypothetical protein
LDNDGGPLLTGALYWNTTSNVMKVYDGAAWITAYLPASGYAQLAATNTFTANQIISANTSSAALSITQAGSGNALYIEDVAADATPFVVSSTGAVGIGTTTPDNVTSAGIALVSNDGYYPQVVNRNKTNDPNASYQVFDKDRAGAVVQSGDDLGNIIWRGFDGTSYLQAAAIIGYSDGTPGTNDMPGALSFLTTADGASAPTERMRISSTGKITDQYGNIRAIPPVGTKTSSYTLTTADVGRYVQVGSGGSITIPNSVFAEGDVVSIFNNTTGSVTITCTIATAYKAGTDADQATVTLQTRGVATVLFISGTVCVISGNLA